jgi:IclR family transcriptional regulator, pca regulon regulatory protein
MSDGDERTRDTGYVQSLERGLAVIRALSGPEPQTLSDVSRSTNLTRATARRFLLTLQRLGYVRQQWGRFALTPQVLELGHAYLSGLTLPEIARPHLARLVDQVHESSSVSVLDGADVVYVARVATRRIMTVSITVGTRFPAHATSMGRVLLAGLDAGERARALADVPLTALTPSTIASPEALEAELERVAAQGYALVDQELEVGLRSIAVPIRDPSGRVAAAVNLSVHAATMAPAEMLEHLLPPLRDTAAAIERDLALGPAA